MSEMDIPSFEGRRHQLFPRLTETEIARMRHFGEPRRYERGALLFEIGERSPGMVVLISGRVQVSRRDGLGHAAGIVEMEAGQFVAEVGDLAGRPSLVDVSAIEPVEGLVIPPQGMRALMVAEADLGERMMRALILRRVVLIETGSGGPVLVGAASSSGMARLRTFLTRNGYPHQVVDPAADADAAHFIEHYAPSASDLPLVVCANGSVMRNPSEAELGSCLGMSVGPSEGREYDVILVGAGPAGLATAVYAASEGLSVLVLDRHAFGGQAGASMRIENYLGFPTGITGQALAGRAFVQAQKFGAEFAIPTEVASLVCGAPQTKEAHGIELGDGRSVFGRAIVVATGARYRRPAIANLKSFEGRGVWYWASPIEAKMCANTEVIVVGGGNSAGQAVVFLAGHAAKVRMMVRGRGLAESMSRYLIDRISAAPNVELLAETEIVALDGAPEAGLERVRWRHRPSGREEEAAIRHVFLFIGADPATEWLAGCVTLDDKGFVKTGASAVPDAAGKSGEASRTPSPLESSQPGVFAVGDARSGSVKRVGAAIGEGAEVVAQIHAFLAGEAAGG